MRVWGYNGSGVSRPNLELFRDDRGRDADAPALILGKIRPEAAAGCGGGGDRVLVAAPLGPVDITKSVRELVQMEIPWYDNRKENLERRR